MQRFSLLSVLGHSIANHKRWRPQWRAAAPKPRYDAMIIGGGGHGLGAAFYLARDHGLRNIAVIEKGWIGGGNTGRNTTIIRSNYLFDESSRLYDHSPKLWDELSQALNYNVGAAWIDISHRQIGYGVSGPDAETCLAGSCPLDLALAAFPIGGCTRTLFHKAEIVLWRTAMNRFHVEAWRSFAGYVDTHLTSN